MAVHALPDSEQVKDEVTWLFTHCQILNKSNRLSGGYSHIAGSRSRSRSEVWWPFTHCQIQNKSAKDQVHGYIFTHYQILYISWRISDSHSRTDRSGYMTGKRSGDRFYTLPDPASGIAAPLSPTWVVDRSGSIQDTPGRI